MRTYPLAAIAVLALSLPGLALAQAKAFPDHPLRFVVPFTAGGNADVVARIVAQGMTEVLKQSVVVDNKPGANAMIGSEAVARAPADGYTLLEATAETHAINPHIYKKVPYDAIRDFAAVGVMDYFPFALVVNPKLPVQTGKEFVAYAKEHAGKLSFASWGVGSTSQIAFEQFKQTAGLDLLHVPFQGAAPAVTAVSAGQVDAFFVPLSVAVPQAKSGRVKLLGTTTAARVASAPEVPTLSEQGYPIVIGGWHVIVAPKAVPKDVVARLNQALNDALARKEVREALLKQGLEPANTSAAEADRMLQAEWQRWGKIAKDAAITVD
ncbi:MAG TPA: tripartite tricarboxylate transporter substrate binding protein [Burkholderiales bacterium]|jgi:tripartite-type tricarboxylate transporter receptor subunit TctC|nr:tripartite tricarboxylate transporter substrate binding protein [Burkholderiales bacterium]